MSGLSDFTAKKVIDHETGKTAMGTLPTAFLALFTTPPTDANTGATEVSGGSYARKTTAGTDWNAASGSAPSSTTNANPLSFAQATADWSTTLAPVWAFGVFDASTVGNLLWWDYLGSGAWFPVIAASGDLASDLLTAPTHGLAANDPIVFTAEFGGSVPTGLTGATTLYYVIATGLTTDQFKVSATLGGSAVDITAVGKCMARKVQTKVIQNGDTASFAAGQLSLTMA